MVVSLKPEKLKRYKDIVRLFVKYGRSDLVSPAGLEGSEIADEIDFESKAASAEE